MDKFLTQSSLILKFLTQKHDITNFSNFNLILENEELLEVFLDHPELNYKTMLDLFSHFIVVQCGKHVECKSCIDFSQEALVFEPHQNNEKYNVFLVPVEPI